MAKCSCLERDKERRWCKIGLSVGNSNGFPDFRFLAIEVMEVKKGDACTLTAFPWRSMNSTLSSKSGHGVSPMFLDGFALCMAVFGQRSALALNTSSLNSPVWFACNEIVS